MKISNYAQKRNVKSFALCLLSILRWQMAIYKLFKNKIISELFPIIYYNKINKKASEKKGKKLFSFQKIHNLAQKYIAISDLFCYNI